MEVVMPEDKHIRPETIKLYRSMKERLDHIKLGRVILSELWDRVIRHPLEEERPSTPRIPDVEECFTLFCEAFGGGCVQPDPDPLNKLFEETLKLIGIEGEERWNLVASWLIETDYENTSALFEAYARFIKEACRIAGILDANFPQAKGFQKDTFEIMAIAALMANAADGRSYPFLDDMVILAIDLGFDAREACQTS